MFGAPSNRLHRPPHIPVGGQQIPSRRQKRGPLNSPSFVLRPGRVSRAIGENGGPDDVAISGYYRMSGSEAPGFVWEQSCVNSPENYVCAALASELSYFISTQRVSCMDANTDSIASLDA